MGALGKWMLRMLRMLQTAWAAILAGCAIGGQLFSWYAQHIEEGCRALLGSAGRRIALALVLLVTVLSGTLGQLAATGAVGIPTAHAQARSGGTPHHFDPKSGTKSTIHLPPASKLPTSTPQTQRPSMAHGFRPSMQPYLLKLDPTTATHFLGSDGRLEIDVPAGAVTASDVKAAGGLMNLRVSEIAPGGGSNAGGSDVISLGSYLVEVVDTYGDRASHGLRMPATLKLHYGSRDTTLDLDSAFVVFNGAHPKSISGLGPYSTQNVTHDRKNHVLQAQLPADPTLVVSSTTPPAFTGGSGGRGGAGVSMPALPLTQQTPLTSFSWDTYSPVAKFGSPDPFNVDLNSGSLTEGLKVDVPPGPAGPCLTSRWRITVGR